MVVKIVTIIDPIRTKFKKKEFVNSSFHSIFVMCGTRYFGKERLLTVIRQ